MKLSCCPAWLAVPILILASCDRPPPPVAAPAPPADPAPALVDERAALEAKIATLRAEEQEAAYRLLQQQQAVLASERDDLERERAELERAKADLAAAAAAPVVAPAAEPVVEKPAPEPTPPPRAPRTASAPEDRDYQLFYEGLAPYGDWRESDEYGWVWQPAEARGSDWRPYTQGRWVDSDQGWAWVSDEPFGWATYHYGRWALLVGNGWVWVPGDTWAPAWVAWRRNDEAVGWAPLPPETLYAENVTYGPDVEVNFGLSAEWYTFIPVRHFDAPVFSHCRPIAENLQFFSLTVGITNIVVRTDRVICGGPEPRWINSCVSRPMARHSIRHRRDWRDRGDSRARIDNNGLNCYSPRVRAEWNDGIRPKHSRGRLEGARVVRRQESIRDDLSRSYRGERDQRRERAAVAMKKEPVRLLAQRHEELESLRANRVAAERKQEDRPRRGTDVPNRQRHLVPPATTEAARASIPKNTRDREDVLSRIDEKRRGESPDHQGRPEVARQAEENIAKSRQAGADQQARQLDKSRRESALPAQRVGSKERPEQAVRNESRSEGQKEEINRREAAERQQTAQAREQAEPTRRAQDSQNDAQRREAAERQQTAQANERNEQARRAQNSQNDTQRREAAERQQAAQARARNEQARRAQDRDNDTQRREAAERQQAAQAKERNEQVRRAQDRDNDTQRREAAERQQAAQARERNEQARRAQDRDNDTQRREAAERQQAAQARERNEQARRAQDRDNDTQRREAAERQQAAQARERNEQARRSQDRENDDRQREAQRRQQEEARSKAAQSDEARARHKKDSDKDR